MGGDEDAVLHEHVGGFEHGIEKQAVPGGVGDVLGDTYEDAAVVAVGDGRAVGVGDPVHFVANEVDAAAFEAGV